MVYKIQIPIGAATDYTEGAFKLLCEHFGCELVDKKKRDVYWTIKTDDPLNFFWLGMNMNFRYKNSIAESVASKFLPKIIEDGRKKQNILD